MNVQLFVTAIERKHLNVNSWDSAKMFHVEQGVVEETEI